METWRDIKGEEGLYQVSNLSRIKSLTRRISHKGNSTRIVKTRILKQTIVANGFY